MEENINQQKSGSPEQLPSEIMIRTMDSDVKAIGEGGGEMISPKPQEFKPEEPKIEAQPMISGYTGPEKPIFTTVSDVLPQPQPLKQTAEVKTETAPKTNSGWLKTIAIIIGIIIVVVGLGLLGYFVVSSWIFPPEMPAVQ